MIRKGQVIRHKRAMDVCFDVVNIIKLPHKLVVKGTWVNMGFVESFPLTTKTTYINIFTEDIPSWHICNLRLAKCLRYSHWRNA